LFFLLVALFSFYLGFTGYRVLSRKTPQQRPSKADWTAASTMLLGGLALVAYGVFGRELSISTAPRGLALGDCRRDRGYRYLDAILSKEAGENEADDGKRFPSDLSKSNAIKKTADGFTYLDPAQFHEYFAADLSVDQAAFMARSQVLNLADNFKAVITTAAWRNKPSWILVATKDRTINPDLERWYAERAKSHKIEVSGASHAVYVSRPKEVAAVIEEAASHTR
jgi:pimeloyl-ACP methyl ester carboxylesterase